MFHSNSTSCKVTQNGPKVNLEGKFPFEMRFGRLRPKMMTFHVNLEGFIASEIEHVDFFVNLECFLVVVRENPVFASRKIWKENRGSGTQNSVISTLAETKNNHISKAQK